MLKTYIRIAFRNLVRHKKYSLINISALTLGIVPVILLLLYIHFETGYDQYHENRERIYRLEFETERRGTPSRNAFFPSPMARALEEFQPAVSFATRITQGKSSISLSSDQEIIEEITYADKSVFDIFSFNLVKGDVKNAMNSPTSIILSEVMAEKYFGKENPLGRTLTLNGYQDLKVTGILENIPEQSHFKIDFLIPADLLKPSKSIMGKKSGIYDQNSWGFSNWFIYFMVREGTDVVALEAGFPDFLRTFTPRDPSEKIKYFFRPVTEIHLHSKMLTELGQNGDIYTVYLYIALAVVIFLIACISYITLATLRSAERAREVGIRKISGAGRKQLIFQFLGESAVVTLVSVFIAFILIVVTLPLFNQYINRNISLDVFSNYRFILWLSAITILVILFSGSYPAFILSALKPVKILRSRLGTAKSTSVRMSLAIIQFVFSTLLIISALVVNDQIEYARSKDLGYSRDHIITIKLNREIKEKLDVLKGELIKYHNISSVSSSTTFPGMQYFSYIYKKVPGESEIKSIPFFNIGVDENFIDMLDLEIIAGRNFSKEFVSDSVNALIINQTAVMAAGWDNALDKDIIGYYNTKPGKVIGIVKDFHLKSLRELIPPIYFYRSKDEDHRILSLKIAAAGMEETIAEIERAVKSFSPEFKFNYAFADELVEKQYNEEKRLANLFNFFAFVAVGIAWLGLFGIISLSLEQRRKEMGIRKIMGASSFSITLLLTRNIALWILYASLIAWPLAWIGANSWLQNFVYHTGVNWALFSLASFILFFVIIATVGAQVYKTAEQNPVDSLRNE